MEFSLYGKFCRLDPWAMDHARRCGWEGHQSIAARSSKLSLQPLRGKRAHRQGWKRKRGMCRAHNEPHWSLGNGVAPGWRRWSGSGNGACRGKCLSSGEGRGWQWWVWCRTAGVLIFYKSRRGSEEAAGGSGDSGDNGTIDGRHYRERRGGALR
jgi:hypothetical protein